MFRPLSENEKKAALRDGVEWAKQEIADHQTEFDRTRLAAETIFAAYLPKHSPTLGVEEARMPSLMKAPPFEELWSVRPKVTFEQP